jgi:hypothetical protein
MKNNIKTKKEFDTVDAMRSIREKISKEIQGMTFEQEKEYLKKRTEKYRAVKRASHQQSVKDTEG